MRASLALAALAFGAVQAHIKHEECNDKCVKAVQARKDNFCPKYVLAEEQTEHTWGLHKCADAAAVTSACECIYTPPATTSSTEPTGTASSSSSTTEPSSTSKPHHTKKYTTSTVYTTHVYTVTSCPPEKEDCPYKHKPTVTTETVPYTTTVCEVEETEEPETPCWECEYPPEETTTSTYCPPTTTMGTTYIPAKPTTTVIPVTAAAGRVEGGLVAAAVGLAAALL